MLIFPWMLFFSFIILPMGGIPVEIWAFAGGAIGALGAYFAARSTIKSSERQWKRERIERNRPIIEFDLYTADGQEELANWVSANIPNEKKVFHAGHIVLVNLGSGSAHNICIIMSEPGKAPDHYKRYLKAGDELNIALDFYATPASSTIELPSFSINVRYEDIDHNPYHVSFSVQLTNAEATILDLHAVEIEHNDLSVVISSCLRCSVKRM